MSFEKPKIDIPQNLFDNFPQNLFDNLAVYKTASTSFVECNSEKLSPVISRKRPLGFNFAVSTKTVSKIYTTQIITVHFF